ncbi:MAG: transposase [Methanomassiliicoccales archaeon]|nr:transposase [Methanomassiliicoccales archaeon]
MTVTMIEIPRSIFNFSGQTHLDTFSIQFEKVTMDFDRYDDLAVNGLRLAMEAIRLHADEFSFWQRRRPTGRPAYDECVVLIGFLVQQLLDLTFRETEGMLAMMQDYYSIETILDYSTLCRMIQSDRFAVVLERFIQHILSDLPTRKVVASTDATGYSGRKRGWRETPHAQRAKQDWVKANIVIEVDEFVILAYYLSDSNVHESQTSWNVWDRLPDNVVPKRSLADSAYVGNDCLAVARQHGATPFHKIKKNAKLVVEPETLYQKLVSFAKHWPKRFAALTAKRAHSETVFSMIDALLGYRLRCWTKAARKNEVRIKFCLFNLIQLAMRKEFWSN